MSNANASISCVEFIRSHTRTTASNIGGNAYSFFDTYLKMSDFVVSESWTDTKSGDGVHHIVRCIYEVKRYNITNSVDGQQGGACGDFWTPDSISLASFANLVNNGGNACFVTAFNGIFHSERLNIVNNTRVTIYFIYAAADYTEFSECCMFRATTHPDYRTYTMINCFTNYAYEGAIVIETSIHPFAFEGNCPFRRSYLFTKQKQIKGIKALKTFGLLILSAAMCTL